MTQADDDRDMPNTELEAFFEAARAGMPDMPAGLQARILADAGAMQPRRQGGLWAQVREALGGWYGLGGLAVAGLAGIWIGVMPPSDAFDPVSMLTADTSYDLFGGSVGENGWSLEEEEENDGA